MKERESDTRRTRIDPKLEAAGWRVVDSPAMTPETSLWPSALPELPTNDGPADYALCLVPSTSKILIAKPRTGPSCASGPR